MHIEYLPSPVVFIGPSGEDSLLVYTYDNILYHYIINSMQTQITLVPVGQIAFNGIVRAPTRVRAISWVLIRPLVYTYMSNTSNRKWRSLSRREGSISTPIG
jgi:hypothetical protein